jgi:septum formation protein
MKIVLASKSPMRKLLLEQAGFEVEVDVSGVDERAISRDSVEDEVMELARQKAEAVAQRHPDSLVVAADTMGFFEGEKLGKMKSDEAALALLKRLNGRSHEVYTGVCVIDTQSKKMLLDFEAATVVFSRMADSRIEDYVSSGEYIGKGCATTLMIPISQLCKGDKGTEVDCKRASSRESRKNDLEIRGE